MGTTNKYNSKLDSTINVPKFQDGKDEGNSSKASNREDIEIVWSSIRYVLKTVSEKYNNK